MVKRLIIATLIATALVMPVSVQAEEITLKEKFEAAMPYITDSETKYATTHVNIRQEPSTESFSYDISEVNTEFEVICEIDGWSMVTTNDGFAYVNSDYLVDQPVEDTNRWGVILSEHEKDLIARIGQLECGGESDLGQQAVFEVILNRMKSDAFPNTLEAVLSQSKQFSTWRNRNSKKATPSERVRANLKLVLSGDTSVLPMQTVYFSTKGEKGKKVQTVIGRHTFSNE